MYDLLSNLTCSNHHDYKKKVDEHYHNWNFVNETLPRIVLRPSIYSCSDVLHPVCILFLLLVGVMG